MAARVFISYRHVQPDEQLATTLAQAASDAGHVVFFDRGIEWGQNWVARIDAELSAADYLLLLLSREAAQSDMVVAEVKRAKQLNAERGRPILLPVRVQYPFSEALPYDLTAYLQHIQSYGWSGEQNTPQMIERLLDVLGKRRQALDGQPERASAQPPSSTGPCRYRDPRELTGPGGAVDVDSRFYVRRSVDDDILTIVRRPRALVTLRGPRQAGKTSLLMRTCFALRPADSGVRPYFIDFQIFPKEALASTTALWRELSVQLVDQLETQADLSAIWTEGSTLHRSLTRLLDGAVFSRDQRPILLCLDEVDRVFASPVRTEFFGSVRALYNRGAMESRWKNVRWLLGTSSEPAFFIDEVSQSPFNIGDRVDLGSFSPDEVARFASLFGMDLPQPLLQRVMCYLGGRPYLVHLFLFTLAQGSASAERLLDPKEAATGLFRDHLHRFLMRFQRAPELAQGMRALVNGRDFRDERILERLEAAGLVLRDRNGVRPYCELYQEFFRRELGPP